MLKLGVIDYLNVQPLYDGLEAHLHGDVTLVRGVPTALNRALVEGAIDIAPISAIEAARHAHAYVILPGLAVASLGAVKTVLLFSRYADPRELDGRRVALTDQSAASVALLKTLCRERYGVTPVWQTMTSDLDTMLATADAALLIGDNALVEGARRRTVAGGVAPYIIDLGDEWLKLTGRPFVFALWAGRRERVDAIRAGGVYAGLHATLRGNLPRLGEIAAAYAPRLNLDAGVCAKYLRDLRYELGEDELAGLRQYLAWALPDFDFADLEFLELTPDESVTRDTRPVRARG